MGEKNYDQEYYTVIQVAKKLQLAANTVRRIFLNVPGVIKVQGPSRPDGRKPYVTMRIPADCLNGNHMPGLNGPVTLPPEPPARKQVVREKGKRVSTSETGKGRRSKQQRDGGGND